jgi:hypothetical protein
MEKAQTDKNALVKGSRKDLSFVRAAGSGGWRSELPAPMVARIESAWGPLMTHLGYELTTHSSADARAEETMGILTRNL